MKTKKGESEDVGSTLSVMFTTKIIIIRKAELNFPQNYT